jgi:purine nucleosidase
MQKLHLDTDFGGDIDDLCALALVLNWPDVEIVGVTTNSDDQGKRAGYTRHALALAGRTDTEVAAGADVTLGCYRVRPGFPDEAAYWPEPVPPAPGPVEQALVLLERSIEQGAIIVAIGAYTNLALLEKRSPGILQHARLFLMGGYVFPPREGFPQWGHEMDWNIQVDPTSALLVLERSNPTLVPLPITVETALRRTHLPALRRSGPLANLIARQAEVFAVDENNEARYGRTCAGLPEDIINFLHDPLACAIALGWNDGVEIREVSVRSEMVDGWVRQSLDDNGTPTRIVTQVKGDRFNDFWLSTVAQTYLS